MRDGFYREMFLIGAFWNWGAGALLLFFQKPLFALYGMPHPAFPIFLQMVCVSVIAFGLGYYWVYRDLNSNRGIVQLGAALKIAVFLFFLYYYWAGTLHVSFLATGAVDLVFAFFFIAFLRRPQHVAQEGAGSASTAKSACT